MQASQSSRRLRVATLPSMRDSERWFWELDSVWFRWTERRRWRRCFLVLARLRNCTAFSRQKTCLKLFFCRNNLRKKSRHLSFAHNMYIFIFTDYCDFIYCILFKFHTRWGLYSYLGTSARLLGRGGLPVDIDIAPCLVAEEHRVKSL